MPSAFTHAIVGAALTPLAPRGLRSPRLALGLATLAALPDLDVLAFRVGIPYAHPLGHRGLSHSLAFAALLAPFAAEWLGRGTRRWTRPWWALVGLCFAATASHGLLDACTDAGLGVGLFLPFSTARIFLPWRPLATSPLSPAAFFSRAGLGILLNEMTWVWLPTAVLLALLWIVRRGADLRRSSP